MAILCYHSVDPNWSSPMSVSPSEFERHCSWLSANKRVVALDARDEAWRDALQRGRVALTFDDGFEELYEHALPVLARYRLPAMIFLVAETLTSGGRHVDWVDDPPSHALTTLNLDQVREMQSAGISFGSHSYAHRDLTQLSETECEEDLRSARELLEDVTGRRITALAYPRGRHDEKVRRAARRAGYLQGFALPDASERGGPLAIPRVGIYGGNGMAALRIKTMPGYLRGRALLLRRADPAIAL